ncbi:hypothetical protein Dsin_015181 [Dipteronia sinensis]|uniref:Cysteine-rich receptor-like protein kinase n=1 Tax=Dipteronia sinensis TaxID=43782 RepID=A0AAE0AC27_9ROSI|nr:hypothetical protein Dsin_015181 [Dipteronia sinensis]
MRSFNSFVLQANGVNLPLHRTSFTWSNNRKSQAWARLDRFLLSPAILLWFPNMIQRSLPRCLSDHNPVIIREEIVDWGPSPFRFLNWWLEEKDMMKESIKWWSECKAVGSQGFVLFSKAKASKISLKRWLQSSKINLKKPKEVEDKLEVLDTKAEREGWTASLRQERLHLLEELWKRHRREEQSWRQKSRIKWLHDGDKNTTFFYSIANSRMRNNVITEMLIEGTTLTDPMTIREGVFKFFKEHFKEVDWKRPIMSRDGLMKISDEEKVALEERFSVEEVHFALWNCDGNKAPGPDGFNLNFIKAHWKEIQDDFMRQAAIVFARSVEQCSTFLAWIYPLNTVLG